METTSIDELVYYRNLLSLNEGDNIEWIIGATPCRASGLSGTAQRGVITAIYPEGKGKYTGKKHAFMTVFTIGPLLNYSVSLNNPTIRKLETDK